MNNFQKVIQLNELIGNKVQTQVDDWTPVITQIQLIQEEFDELLDAAHHHDIYELRDAMSDLLVTTYGLAYLTGVDADLDMAKVHESNLSKFCRDYKEVQATQEQYQSVGVTSEVRERNDRFAVVSDIDQYSSDNKFYPKGKLLKSINFVQPEFI